MTPKEILSLRFLRVILEEWGVSQSFALGNMLSLLSLQQSSNSSSSGSSSNSTNSSNSSSSGSSSSDVLEEVCTVCGASIVFTLPSKEKGAAVCTSTCKSCGTFFDRCCTTFLTIGFDAIMSGNVLMCSVCSSTGLLHRNDKILSNDIALDTNKRKSNGNEDRKESAKKKKSHVLITESNDDFDGEALDCRKEFDWFWWDMKAPYCPYCSILMLPLL